MLIQHLQKSLLCAANVLIMHCVSGSRYLTYQCINKACIQLSDGSRKRDEDFAQVQQGRDTRQRVRNLHSPNWCKHSALSASVKLLHSAGSSA